MTDTGAGTPLTAEERWTRRLFKLNLALEKAYQHAHDSASLDDLMRRDMALGVAIDRLTEHVATKRRQG